MCDISYANYAYKNRTFPKITINLPFSGHKGEDSFRECFDWRLKSNIKLDLAHRMFDTLPTESRHNRWVSGVHNVNYVVFFF